MLLVLSEHGHYNGLDRSEQCNFCICYNSIQRASGFAVQWLGVEQGWFHRKETLMPSVN